MNSISRSFTVKKDGLIALEGSRTAAINLLLQGRLEVYVSSLKKGLPLSSDDLKQKSYRLFGLDQNLFIGINDLLRSGKNSLSYIASTDSNLFSYPVDNAADTMNTIHNQKDYGAYVIHSLSTLINNCNDALQQLSAYTETLKSIYHNLCIYYLSISEVYQFGSTSEKAVLEGSSGYSLLKNMNSPVPVFFNRPFIEAQEQVKSVSLEEASEDRKKIDYYIHLFNMPSDLKKAFFGADRYITSTHITDSCAILDLMLLKLRQARPALWRSWNGYLPRFYKDCI